MIPSRRRMLGSAAALGLGAPAFLLSACGFHPVYGDAGASASPGARAQLAAISVAIIPERSGQLLRQALQDRFERFGSGVARRYDLQASFAIADDPVAIQSDSSVTFIRRVGHASYTLVSLDARRQTITSGSARVVDGYDVVDQQYFAADLQSEAIQRRMAEAAADQIALQLGLFFDRRARQAAGPT